MFSMDFRSTFFRRPVGRQKNFRVFGVDFEGGMNRNSILYIPFTEKLNSFEKKKVQFAEKCFYKILELSKIL